MELFTKFELIVMISVIGFLMFLVILLSIIEFICSRKEKRKVEASVIEPEKVKDESNNQALVLENPKEEEEAVVTETNNLVEEPALIKIEPKPNDIVIEDMDKIEIVPSVSTDIPENVETLELEPKEKAQIELLKVEEALENPETLEDTITNFETLEEEDAIISYQELLSVTKEMQIINLDDAGDEPISITEVYQKFDTNMDESSLDVNNEDYLATYNENESLTEIQLENTANLEKLDKEIRKTNKFLNILNELKKNLD